MSQQSILQHSSLPTTVPGLGVGAIQLGIRLWAATVYNRSGSSDKFYETSVWWGSFYPRRNPSPTHDPTPVPGNLCAIALCRWGRRGGTRGDYLSGQKRIQSVNPVTIAGGRDSDASWLCAGWGAPGGWTRQQAEDVIARLEGEAREAQHSAMQVLDGKFAGGYTYDYEGRPVDYSVHARNTSWGRNVCSRVIDDLLIQGGEVIRSGDSSQVWGPETAWFPPLLQPGLCGVLAGYMARWTNPRTVAPRMLTEMQARGWGAYPIWGGARGAEPSPAPAHVDTEAPGPLEVETDYSVLLALLGSSAPVEVDPTTEEDDRFGFLRRGPMSI